MSSHVWHLLNVFLTTNDDHCDFQYSSNSDDGDFKGSAPTKKFMN